MASNVVNVVVRADSSQLTTAFDKTVSAGERFKAKMGLVGQAVVAALAVKAVTAAKDFAVDSIRAFTDLNESLNALEVTYGQHADGIKKLGEESARNLGISNSEFNNFAVSIANFAKEIAGEGGDVVAVVDTMTTRITDFASVMNIDVAEAQEKFQSGLAGQSRPLREFGIDVSDAAVKAFALANGIGDASGELTEGEKVQARYGAIMEQTANVAGDFANTSDELANKERILNAELENSKALMGEILAPMKAASQEMQGGLIKSLNDAAIQLGFLTGALSDGEAALLSFKNQTGETADTAEDVIEGVRISWLSWTHEIDVWADTLFGGTRKIDAMSDGLRELIAQQDLTTDSITELKDELLDLLHSGTITEEEFHALSDTLDKEFGKAMADARGEMQTTLPAQKNLITGTEDLEDATEDATDAIKTQNQLIRENRDLLRAQIDPVFAYMKATNDLAEAEAELNRLEKENKEGTPEYLQAAEDKARANLELQESVAAIGEEGVPAAVAALQTLGVPESVIKKFAEDKKRIEEIFRNMVLRIGVSAPTLYPTTPSGGGVGWSSDTKTYYPHGGIARQRFGGQEANIASTSDESVIPLNRQGAEFMANMLNRFGVNGSGSGIHFHGPVYGLDDFERKLQEVIVRARRRGVAI